MSCSRRYSGDSPFLSLSSPFPPRLPSPFAPLLSPLALRPSPFLSLSVFLRPFLRHCMPAFFCMFIPPDCIRHVVVHSAGCHPACPSHSLLRPSPFTLPPLLPRSAFPFFASAMHGGLEMPLRSPPPLWGRSGRGFPSVLDVLCTSAPLVSFIASKLNLDIFLKKIPIFLHIPKILRTFAP